MNKSMFADRTGHWRLEIRWSNFVVRCATA